MASLLLTCVLIPVGIQAQQPWLPPSTRAGEIQTKISHISPNAPISVIPLHGEEVFGDFVSSDRESFTFYDVDHKVNTTLRYEEVKKIKNGYGGYNRLRQRHTDPTRRKIGIALGIGLIAGLILGVAFSL
jgi:hypothetical protein